MHRSSLEPIEEANAFKKYVLDLGWGGISELASKLGRSHSYIIKRIMLLDLPQDIIDFINNRQLTPSAAEELFPIRDESKRSELAKLIVDRQLSSKEARNVVRSTKNQPVTTIALKCQIVIMIMATIPNTTMDITTKFEQ